MAKTTSEMLNELAVIYARAHARRRCGGYGEACNDCTYESRGDCDYRELRKAWLSGALTACYLLREGGEP